MLSSLGQRAWEFVLQWAGRLFILGLFGTAALSAVMYTAVHHTAQPEFCNSCHIMEPYFKSWQDSSHANVACIDCHYEPGAVETLEGKFKALSQLAKYVTRTQGTKPWAEVSDASCMRTGCHSVRMLDGPVSFGRVDFDHRQHLLESRRGRRLRCTSCHSQIVQGEHVSVTPSVCFMCHFMPDAEGQVVPQLSECTKCHGAPTEDIQVGDKAFQHHDYVARGVDCRECHDPVIEGKGTVRKERCHSCHGEVGHIERFGETAFLHEAHVTEHKVECFECHDEIHHGLLPLAPIEPARNEGCGSCHENTHDAARKLYAGEGAVGVDSSPSRMYLTRVVCNACHTGRSDEFARHGATLAAKGADHHGAHAIGGTVASAGNVDCIHCHGPEFDGMVDEWQGAVGEQLERLGPMIDELRKALEGRTKDPSQELLADAERNYLLVKLDGSRGVHNVTYALDALRVAAERVDTVRASLGVVSTSRASEGFPVEPEQGCNTCHAGIGRSAEISRAERVFPHQKHLGQGAKCESCHSVTEHGKPAFPRNECAKCHHQESASFDVSDCSRCHKAQDAMLRGTLATLTEPKPGTMGAMECYECHGEAPAIARPKPSMCVLCHEAGYDALHTQWQGQIDALVKSVEAALPAAASRGVDAEVLAKARAALDTVRADGTRGVHNFELAKLLLEEAVQSLGSK
ncbi:MAG: cytochrome c3 family protein [Planctomycetes bacterium]|nr:cytochrome c3 family protein [Planctomycetota bacterium]